jgi:hypothetical protein
MSARGFLGSGDLYINRIVGGVAQGWEGPFEATKFEIKPNVEQKELASRGKTSYGQVIETVSLAKPSDLKIDMPEVNKTSLAVALLGTTAALAQGSGTVTDEVITAVHDKWVPLAYARLGDTFTLTNSAGSTTYVNGTDYLVNKTLGWVKVLSTGAIADSASLKFDYTYQAISGMQVKGATSSDVRAKFKLDGVNQVDGLPCIVTIHEGVIAADSAFDFLSNDFNTISLPGRMKTPAGYNEPFTVDMRNAA